MTENVNENLWHLQKKDIFVFEAASFCANEIPEPLFAKLLMKPCNFLCNPCRAVIFMDKVW